jgi:hypothetical protein
MAGLTRPSTPRRFNDEFDIAPQGAKASRNKAFALTVSRRQFNSQNTWIAESSPAMTLLGHHVPGVGSGEKENVT